VRTQSDEQHRLLWPTGPKIDRVDGIARRLCPDERQRDGDIVGADLRANKVERLEGHLLCTLYSSACWCAEPQLKLPGVNGREDIPSQPSANDEETDRNDDNISHQDLPPEFHRALHLPPVPMLESEEETFLVMFGLLLAQQPDGENRHQRVCQYVGSKHGKAHRERQRDKE